MLLRWLKLVLTKIALQPHCKRNWVRHAQWREVVHPQQLIFFPINSMILLSGGSFSENAPLVFWLWHDSKFKHHIPGVPHVREMISDLRQQTRQPCYFLMSSHNNFFSHLHSLQPQPTIISGNIHKERKNYPRLHLPLKIYTLCKPCYWPNPPVSLCPM